MRFSRLLIHRCTILKVGQVVGKDSYGRDKYEDISIPDVPCRVDQIRRVVTKDDFGTDVVVENILFLSPDQELDETMKIVNVKDKNGSDVLKGTFAIKKINPVYRRSRLHHYEITLEKESDISGE